MRHSDTGNTGRFAALNQTQNQQSVLQQSVLQSGVPTNPVLGTSPRAASQPPPYPGTQSIPNTGSVFPQQQHTHYPELRANLQYQQPSVVHGPAVFNSNASSQSFGLHAGCTSPHLSPGSLTMQSNIRPVSPGAVGVPRKSLAGMISPIRQQAPQFLNMPPPSSPVVVGGRMQGPLSPLTAYMSQTSQRRLSADHTPSLSSRSSQSPVYCQNPVPYNFSPQRHQGVLQRSPTPSPMYVDPAQHGQISPVFTHGPHHSPQSVGAQGIQIVRSPYKAARQLNMSTPASKTPQYVPPGGTNQPQWQCGYNTGCSEAWENVSVTPLAPLPILTSDTLDLLSTITVSTASSPMQPSSNVTVVDSQMPRSTLLEQHLLMPATPIRTSLPGSFPMTSGESSTRSSSGAQQCESAHTAMPPSRSNSKQTARLTLDVSAKKATKKPVTESRRAVTTPTTSAVISVKSENTFRETMTSPITNTIPSYAEGNSATVSDSLQPAVSAPTDDHCDIPMVDPEIIEKRMRLLEAYRARLQNRFDLYKEHLTELFFLRNGGNFMDYTQFKKRPSTKLLDYLKSKLPDLGTGQKAPRKASHDSTNGHSKSPDADVLATAHLLKVAPEGCVRKCSVSRDDGLVSPEQRKDRKDVDDKRLQCHDEATKPGELQRLIQQKTFAQVITESKPPPSKLKRLPKQSTSNQLDESIGSQEEILERAKQEAVIQRKVVELRKQGLWSQRRLPKVQEPPRSKTHWDYMLEEMRWLAADFAQERKWKRAAARKLVRAVAAFHKDQHDQERRAKKEEQNRLRRIASTMARGIREFWGNVGKVVEYKQRSLLDEKRKEALDMHLDFVVGQTEKYSDWLVKGLNQPTGLKDGSDDDFLPHGQSTDDEETIAVAEQDPEEENEVLLLTQESKLPFDDLLSSLPEDLIENIGKPLTENAPAKPVDSTEQVVEEPASDDSANEASVKKPSSISLRRSARKRKLGVPLPEQLEAGGKRLKENEEDDADDAFDARNEDSAASDDESTIAKEEEQENVDHGKEIADLEAEGALSIEELLKMYGAPASPNQEDQGSGVEEIEADQVLSEAEQDESSCEEEDGDDEDTQNEDIGMDYLLKVDADKDDIGPMIIPADEKPRSRDSSPSKEITDVAAEAASLQPTGFTLATTQVVTPIPSLLKHTLREYQHIGLDWLVTMYDKRLNGILADEMGLGKTIQTIALLAHLACDKGVWGPHLVVVPTSVMLNWEMEFKKWCPGFKILTYYGSQKERKAKRTGWTKSNAFHVCITSYKLVLQDNSSFRRKKWKYLILDEAQNIKNFKSQRWQTLLNFNSHRRLLLTGTPLQNNLMELWSLMHFLMPHVFQSHKEFKEWFSNPLTGMVEGGQEYNEKLVRRLHKVLRPFLLRRIKKDVEKQMPNKYEHVVRCHLSKRQRFLYDDFMSQASTKDTLESGHFMSVINILMQLRKVCNHPNLFEPRPIVSPFFTDQISYHAPSLATKAMEKTPWESLNLRDYHMHLPTLSNIHQTHVDLIRRYRTPRKLIEEIPEDGGAATSAREELPKAVSIKEQLVNLIKERSKSGKTSQQSAHKPVPYLTIPITSSTGSLQLPSTSGQAIVQSRVITIPQSKSEDSVSGRTASSPAFTLQYQTSQGTRVSIPSKQIKQLPANILRIMTPAMSAKTPAPNAQNVASSSVQGGSTIRSKAFSKTNTDESTTEREMIEVKEPGLYTERLEEEFMRQHKERCLRVAEENEKRCCVTPTWLPGDTVSFLKDIYQRCDRNKPHTVNSLKSDVILELVKSASCRTKELKPITDRFAFVIPLVESKPIDFYVSHPSPSIKLKADQSDQCLQEALKVSLSPFHSIILSTRIQFPEARLIQYDCGKLQVLDVLLRRFYTEKHKCLIFTQMTKVLDILEAFLSYHGYRYLRLDGSTRVEQRMLLMERFNNDPRIFCFILSTRSGGIGVNLTGADTVIFYDSDWNPTMDAQAQDRCHRIGQTRDVHIYRLISERTVEENILKKANQKRLLGDIAIEGGSFTTAFFKEQAIKDLFDKPTGLEDLPTIAEKPDAPETEVAPSKPLTARQKAIAAAKEAKSDKEGAAATSEVGPSLEDVLQQTEDKEDVDAAKQLREEQDADMEEFTENADEDQTAVSRVHEEMKSIYEELTPIEKYALRYLEETTEEVNREELEQAEERVYRSKQDWELAHLVALKEEEERRLEEEEDEIFYTREDAENQVNDSKHGKKSKRKKERDICFYDMSTSSSEDDDKGVDVEGLENEQMVDDALGLAVSVTIPKLKGFAKKKTPVKTKKKMSVPKRGGRGGARAGRGRGVTTNRYFQGELTSPSKRRRASNLTHDITMHGYYENSDFLYYNDDTEGDVDSDVDEEAPWDDEIAWSDREDWPETPPEDNLTSDDEMGVDNTVCILTEDTPEKFDPHSSFWNNPTGHGRGSRELVNKVPLYNVVVETNVTPNKLFSRANLTETKPKTVESIAQRVNKTINNNPHTSTIPVFRPLIQNVVPTISLRPRPRLPAPIVRPVSVYNGQCVSSIRPISIIPMPVQSRPQALNTILQQQAAQRQKLQSYKIPLKTGTQPNKPPPRVHANSFSNPGVLQVVSCTPQTRVIQLAKLSSGNISALPKRSSNSTTPARILPNVPRQTFVLQPAKEVIPVQIVPSTFVKSFAVKKGLHRNINPKSSTPSRKKQIVPPGPDNTSKVGQERGLFDIVNSVEFLESGSVAAPSDKGSLFDSLEQEFMAGSDMTLGDDDMITLNLEPVSPSDPQLVSLDAVDDNEEERNVFESFQSLLEQ